MRSADYTHVEPVARAETKEELIAFLKREKVELYKDEGLNHHHVGSGYKYSKSFRKGGPLEWRNFPLDFDSPQHFVDVGTKKDCITRASEAAVEQWDYQFMGIPEAASLS